MVFSTNQVRHLYVAKNVPSLGNVKPSDAPGEIKLVNDTAKTNMYFQYRGADNLMRSDLIPLKNIISAKTTKAIAMAKVLKSVKVSLDKSINEGNPIAGEDYIVKVFISQYLGMSDDSTTQKFGAVHAFKGMTPEKFYVTLAASLFMNFSREVYPLVRIKICNKTITAVKKDPSTKEYKLLDKEGAPITTTSADGVTIQGYPQEWVLGTKSQDAVLFDVVADTVELEGTEVEWATIVDTTPKLTGKDTFSPVLNFTADPDAQNAVANGKEIADLEYFCMSERGDVYKNMGWPNVIPTTYLVDPTKEYNVLDIHYYYEGGNEGPQKSEKTITIVCDTESEALGTIITAFNALSTVTGITLDTLA